MKRWLFFVYGVTNHLLFLAVYAWMGCFVGNVLVAKSIDTPSGDSLFVSLVIDLALILLFGLQHSVMARPTFKRVWTRIVPKPIERSTYVLASNLAVAVLFWQWRGIDLVVWDAPAGFPRNALLALFAIGWLLVPAVSLMIDHFDLFGSRQVWLHLIGREYTTQPFRTPMLYGRVRHPLYVGWALFFWATPTMTVGHLLFAGTLTFYMALASVFEERNLIEVFGRQYEEYRRRVPRFVPAMSLPREEPNPVI